MSGKSPALYTSIDSLSKKSIGEAFSLTREMVLELSKKARIPLQDVLLLICPVSMIIVMNFLAGKEEPSGWISFIWLILILITYILSLKSSKYLLMWTVGPLILISFILMFISGSLSETIRSGEMASSSTDPQNIGPLMVIAVGLITYEIVAVPVYLYRRARETLSNHNSVLETIPLYSIPRYNILNQKNISVYSTSLCIKRSLNFGVKLGRSAGFRIYAYELVFFGLILLMLPFGLVRTNELFLLAIVFIIPIIGLIALFVWQLIRGTYEFWTALWKRSTPHNTKYLNSNIKKSNKLWIWENFYKSESDVESPDFGSLLIAIWRSLALFVLLVLLGLTMMALLYVNILFNLPILDLMLKLSKMVIAELLFWYDPGVKILISSGMRSNQAELFMGFVTITAPSGAIIAKYLVYYMENKLYKLYFGFEILGRIQFVLLAVLFNVAIASGALLSIVEG
jgi:hypothetical protein